MSSKQQSQPSEPGVNNSGKSRLAFVAQRPSDFVEIRRAATALSARGYPVVIFYHPISEDLSLDQSVLSELRNLERRKISEPREIVLPEPPPFFQRYLRRSQARAAMRSQVAAPPIPRKSRLEWLRAPLPSWLPTSIREPLERALNSLADFLEWGVRVFFMLPTVPARTRVLVRRGLDKIGVTKLFYELQTGYYIIAVYRHNLDRFRGLLKARDVDAIVLPEDIVGPITPIYIRAGHQLGIPSLILPYTVANQEEAFQGLRSQPNYQLAHPVNRFVTLLSRRWRMSRDNCGLVRMPAPYIIGHWVTHTAPPDPWLMNSGFANCVAVENAAMEKYYLKSGLPATKLRVVGAVYDDYLAKYRNAREEELPKLRRELGLVTDKPLLVIGGCPNQLVSSVPACDFSDMESIARFIMEAIQPLHDVYEIVVRPHPNYTEFGDMCASFGATNTTIDTARLVALSSSYIAFASATLRWSIACCVPSVNYDVFHYGYGEFASVRGVFTVSGQKEFAETVQALRPDSQTYDEARAALESLHGHWGRLDGKSVDRISELIDECCALSPVPRTAA